MRNAIVFGCTGQDGSLLCRSLLRRGFHVIGASRSSNPNLSIHRELGISGEIDIITADICDFREILDLFVRVQPDEVYNLAAQSSVALSFQQPVDTFNSIINGTINILEVARYAQLSSRIYFAGSSEIFGHTPVPATVQSNRRPVSPYAIAKDASFNTVALYRQAFGVQCVTGVLFNHESPYRPAAYVTKKIIQGAVRCKRDPSHRLYLGDLDVGRDWGWAEEYVEAMQLILRADLIEDQVICTGRMETLEYFVSKAFSMLDLDWQHYVVLSPHLRRPSEIRSSVGDPSAMIRLHDWKAKYDVDDVIQKLLESATKTSHVAGQ